MSVTETADSDSTIPPINLLNTLKSVKGNYSKVIFYCFIVEKISFLSSNCFLISLAFSSVKS